MASASITRSWLPLLLGLILLSGFLSSNLTAQKPQPPREEEEEPGRPKLKPPLRIDDAPDPVRHIGARPVDLQREAQLAKHAAVRDLYRRLAVPHDEVRLAGARQPLAVQPLAEFVGLQPTFDGKLTVRVLEAGTAAKEGEYKRKQITGVEHYEALAVSQANRFLEAVKDDTHLTRLEALQHAERALAEVMRFHEFARGRNERRGTAWALLERDLRKKLRGVRLGQLSVLAEARDWSGALDLTNQLAEIYPHDAEVAAAIVGIRAGHLTQTLDDEKIDTFVAARQALEQLDRQFPEGRQHEAAQKLRGRLQNKAAALLQSARTLAAKDKSKAIAQMRTVANIWPQLPGLQELRQELRPYKPLGVGVRHLPVNLSPATAVTDTEKQSVELIFEGLLRPVADAQVGQRYEPVLSAGPPRTVSLGREFQLISDASWYRSGTDGKEPIEKPLTATDVSRTIALYQEWAGRSPEWSELLSTATVDEKDRFRIRLSLRQGYLDPLSLMTFKVLPARQLEKADDRAFARHPVGSGPYQYLGIKNSGSRGEDFALFLANPTYARRKGKQELPHIPAIHFYRSRDVVKDFKSGQLHLLLDLPTPRIKEITAPAAGLSQVHVYTLRNRRVWFLAVNHRDPRLHNDRFCRALAHAIDREKILNDIFRDNYRDERGELVHRSLNGPFPAGSWACDLSLKADPFKADLARHLAKEAKAPAATLLYPNDLPQVEEACKAIQEQAQAIGLKIVLKGASWTDVHRAVVRDHQYELAYFCWDYANDAFWLGSLFGMRGAEASLLGPLQDPLLEDLLRQVRQHRDFTEVHKLMRQLHHHLHDKMPLIPLWQLDTHIAVHEDLQTVPAPRDFEPLLVFPGVEQWRLVK